MFELAFAFSPWTMGGTALGRLGIAESEWQAPGFNLLTRLGFTKSQISQASDIICGRGTIEGAPHIKPGISASSMRPTNAVSMARATSPLKATSA